MHAHESAFVLFRFCLPPDVARIGLVKLMSWALAPASPLGAPAWRPKEKTTDLLETHIIGSADTLLAMHPPPV